MPRKPKAISKNKIPEIAASLKAKASTPITVTLEDLVKSLAEPIQSMLDAGYSYEDVAAVFTSHGVELAASGIKNYHKQSKTSALKSSPSPDTQSKPEIPVPEIIESEPEQSNNVLPESKVSTKSKFNITDRRNI